eukprot:s3834_g5.t1
MPLVPFSDQMMWWHVSLWIVGVLEVNLGMGEKNVLLRDHMYQFLKNVVSIQLELLDLFTGMIFHLEVLLLMFLNLFMVITVRLEVIEQRLLRGLDLANEEFRLLELGGNRASGVHYVDILDTENRRMEDVIHEVNMGEINMKKLEDVEMKTFNQVITHLDREITIHAVPLKDSNLWAIQSHDLPGEVLGYMAIYVDDVMCIGPAEVTQGVEGVKSGGYLLHQLSYTQELLNRHDVQVSRSFIKVPEEPEDEPEITPKLVKEAQGIAGELLWLRWAIKLGRHVLEYLLQTKDVGLLYGPLKEDNDPELTRRTPRINGAVEVLADASFGVGDAHSVSGMVILYADAPIHWDSRSPNADSFVNSGG